jgi:glycolate oxidase FAD binding subunit
VSGWTSVDDLPPAALYAPADEGEVAELLQTAFSRRWAVVVQGGGSQMSLGNPPARLDAVLSLSRLAGVTEYTPADLVVEALAGTPLADLEAVLRRRGQTLGLSAVAPAGTTVGGLVATGAASPHRLAHGTPRDRVLGLSVVLADGTRVRTGGRVVKNVAGYDLTRLFVGSLGTLGVIARAVVRVRPLPRRTALAILRAEAGPPPPALLSLALDRALDPVGPAAAELVDPSLARRLGVAAEAWALLLALEGEEAEVAERLRRARALAAQRGAVLEVREGEEGEAVWEALGRAVPSEAGVQARLSVRRRALLPMAETLAGAAWPEPWRAWTSLGVGTGVVRLWLSAAAPAPGGDLALEAALTALRRAAQAGEGALVLERASPALRRRMDAWGPARADIALMRALKERLDPRAVLAPGRFVGGI